MECLERNVKEVVWYLIVSNMATPVWEGLSYTKSSTPSSYRLSHR